MKSWTKKVIVALCLACLVVMGCQQAMVLPQPSNLKGAKAVLTFNMQTALSSERSAYPASSASLPDTWFYEATATTTTPGLPDIRSGRKAPNLSLTVLQGYDWTITIKAYANETSPDVLMEGSANVTADAPSIQVPIVLKVPAIPKGTGSISLKINTAAITGCTSVEFADYSGGGDTATFQSGSFWTFSATDVTPSSTGYSLTFVFKNGTDVLGRYYADGIVVYPGMLTNRWFIGSDAETETLAISTASLALFKYVASGLPNVLNVAGNDTTGLGSMTAPYATVTKALEQCTLERQTYTIYIAGMVQEPTVTLASCSNKTIKLVGLGIGAGIMLSGANQVIGSNNENLHLSLENLTITGGTGGYGAAVYFAGTWSNLTIKNCSIKGNNGQQGGALCYRSNGGALTIENSTFENNTAINEGCIYTTATITKITGCTIKGNTASSGGGVFVDGGNCTITNTTIEGNTAGGKGGGLYVNGGTCVIGEGTIIKNNTSTNNGGGLYVGNATCTITGAEITGNKSTNYSGGGLYVNGGTCTITDTRIHSNITTGGGDSNGGGLYVETVTLCTIAGSTTIQGNTAAGKGQGVFVGYGPFAMSGAAKVEADNDVYLLDNPIVRFITITGALTSNFAAKITSETTTPGTVVLKGDGYTLTATDCAKFALISPAKNIALSGNTGIIGAEDVTVVTASNAVTDIENLTANAKVKVVGPMTATQLQAISTAIKGKVPTEIGLDLSATTGLTEIPASRFNNVENLTSIYLPEGLSAIKDHAFEKCSKLSDVKLPSTLITLEDYAFGNCFALETIVIPEGVTELPARCFYYTNKIKNVTLPSTLKKIGYSCFASNYIESINLPAGLQEIGTGAFAQSVALTSFAIPSSVTTIDGNPVPKSPLLTTITSESTNFVVEANILYNSDKTKLIAAVNQSGAFTVAGTVTEIAPYAFYGSKITSVSAPATVTSIGLWSFRESTLTTATFYGDITSIPGSTFYSCTDLATITINSTSLPSVGSYAFDCKRTAAGGTTVEFPNVPVPAGWPAPSGWDANWKGTSTVNVTWGP